MAHTHDKFQKFGPPGFQCMMVLLYLVVLFTWNFLLKFLSSLNSGSNCIHMGG